MLFLGIGFSCFNYEWYHSTLLFRGSTEATRQAHNLIAALIKDPEVDILTMLPKATKQAATATWDKSAVSSFLPFDFSINLKS